MMWTVSKVYFTNTRWHTEIKRIRN